jgi:hypothetical protein
MQPGEVLASWTFAVEAGKIREFARAVRDPHAETSLVAPPTFPVVASSDFVERLVADILKLDRRRTVHGEQAFEYVRPIVAGDRLRCTARLEGDVVKTGGRGGAMRVVTTSVEYAEEATGAPVCRETMTSIEKASA